MIIKSMSRKEPSFAQLAAYLSSEKADADYDLYHNCFSRNHEDIADEFFENSKLLSKRRNGNYLYHEIISFSVEPDVTLKALKDGLRDAADKYISDCCPRNMVYGCLHQDHDHHLHYHLMFTANERGDRSRLRLPKKQYEQAKHDCETYVLTTYPELKQKPLITAKKQTEKITVKAGEMKRRTGKIPKREAIKNIIVEAMNQTSTMHDFISYLSERGYQFYTRGKNFGVEIENETGKIKRHRFSSLGIHDDFVEFSSAVESIAEAQSTTEQEATPEEWVETITPEPSEFLQELEEKRQKKLEKKARKGKPRSK